MLQSFPAEIDPAGIVRIINAYILRLHILHQSHELNIEQGKNPVPHSLQCKFIIPVYRKKIIYPEDLHIFLNSHLKHLANAVE